MVYKHFIYRAELLAPVILITNASDRHRPLLLCRAVPRLRPKNPYDAFYTYVAAWSDSKSTTNIDCRQRK